MSKSYVRDANAVLDFVEDGPGGKRVEPLLNDALHGRSRVLMSVVNWGEVFYHSWQEQGEECARRTLAGLSRLPSNWFPLTGAIAAGREIKARHKIPYDNCIAAGLAILQEAVLVTSDRDFEKRGRRVEILRIR